MGRQGTFYLGRVIKGGRLDHDRLLSAFSKPAIVEHRGFGWTFSGLVSDPLHRWHYCRLTKFKPDGVVRVIDHAEHREVPRPTPDMIVADSPFVYVPEYSGIAYLHVWNQIQRTAFPKRFADVVDASLGHFFVHCEVEPISDIRTFLAKVAGFDSVDSLSARVHLPNPLFSPLWESLKDYVARRNAQTVLIEEQSRDGQLKTDLPRLARILRTETVTETKVEIGDAAILMAADGYGSAKVSGSTRKTKTTIRTSQSQVNFSYEGDAAPDDLAERSQGAFSSHASTRGLRHGSRE